VTADDEGEGDYRNQLQKNFHRFYRGDGTYCLTSEAIWMFDDFRVGGNQGFHAARHYRMGPSKARPL
jgi:hypothetical protein